MATANQTPMKGKPEVDALGIHPKSKRTTGKPVAGTLNHTNKHEKRGRNWLRFFVSGVLVTSAFGAEFMLYTAGFSVTTTINLMWLVGVSYAAAYGVVNFCKLE